MPSVNDDFIAVNIIMYNVSSCGFKRFYVFEGFSYQSKTFVMKQIQGAVVVTGGILNLIARALTFINQQIWGWSYVSLNQSPCRPKHFIELTSQAWWIDSFVH